ncbi:arylalcohol dehydrogenase [Salix suchowensis]|nr:arylalcohol dehydrogenase [Salix suchowensis]
MYESNSRCIRLLSVESRLQGGARNTTRQLQHGDYMQDRVNTIGSPTKPKQTEPFIQQPSRHVEIIHACTSSSIQARPVQGLSPKAGIYVSPLALGAMSIGDKWDSIGLGAMNKESSFELLDAYYDNGGNFIDTSSNYQDETSEQFIGEWAEKRGIRDQLVIATKYSMNYKRIDPNAKIAVNYVGNHLKNMLLSVEASLKKLRTTYIDILYVHWWGYDTSIEEPLISPQGASNVPAWVVATANQYARDHGKTPFSVYQGSWSIMERSFERDIIPMARKEGLALVPWGVLAGGKLRTDAEEQRRKESGEKGRELRTNLSWERTESEAKISRALGKVASEVGAKSVTAVAIAYVMQKTTHVVPIIGGRKVEHLLANLEALDISLSKDQVEYIEGILPFERGFPYTVIVSVKLQS